MRASHATDFDGGYDGIRENNIQDFFRKNPGLVEHEESKFDFLPQDINMNGPTNLGASQKINCTPKGTISNLNLSAIQPDLSVPKQEATTWQDEEDDLDIEHQGSEERNFASLNRNLMPTFEVVVRGGKILRLPKLDIERVIELQERKNFTGNLPFKEEQSLITDLNTNLDDAGQSQSFQNESASKSKNPS